MVCRLREFDTLRTEEYKPVSGHKSGTRMIQLRHIALFALSLFMLSAEAQDDCQTRASELLDTFDMRMNQIIEARELTRIEIVSDGLSAVIDPMEQTRVRDAIKGMVERTKIDSRRTSLSEYAVNTLNAAIAGDSDACKSFDWFDLTLQDSTSRMDAALHKLEQFITSRLKAVNLGPDEGFAIIAVYSSGFSQSIHLNRRRSIKKSLQIGPLNSEQYFEVVKLKAGEYNWSTVKLGRNRPYFAFDFSDKDLSFNIVAGKLNYTGVYVFERSGMQHAFADINDRASIVLQIMERRFPDLLAEYDVVNGLVPDDTFIEFYLGEKARVRGAMK